MDLDNINIKEQLAMWGRWVSGGVVVAAPKGGCAGSCTPLGYKSVWATLIPSGSGGSYGCDDDMLLIDNAICNLRFNDKFAYKLIKLKYRYGYPYQRLAQKLTKELPEYRKGGKKAGMKMCNTYCKGLVNDAEEQVLVEIKAIIEATKVVVKG